MVTPYIQRLMLSSVLAASVVGCSRQTTAPPCAVRFTIPPPADTQFAARQIPALSPDGSRVAFTAVDRDRVTGLWVQSLRRSDATLVPGTAGATLPFWSPDGQKLGFFAEGRLKWIDLRSGAAQVLAEVPDARGGSWGARERIVFAGSAHAIFSISPTGGAVRQLTNLDNAAGVVDSWPTFLPDGEHFLYASVADAEKRHLFLGSIRSSERIEMFGGMNSPVKSVGPGFLLFVGDDDDILIRVRFDPKLFEVEQPPAMVAQAIARGPSGMASFTASADGTAVVYGRGGRQIVWLDAAGRETAAIPDPGSYQFPILSPSGEEILVAIGAHWLGNGSGLYYVYQTKTAQWRQVSDGAGGLRNPLWSADGKEIIFTQAHDAVSQIVALRPDGTGATRKLFDVGRGVSAAAVSATGGLLALEELQLPAPSHLRVVSLSGGGGVVAQTVWSAKPAGNTHSPAFSPDGLWLAYVSDESGVNEVYVSQLGTGAIPVQVSLHGGTAPAWSGDGQQLFYRTRSGIVAVTTQGIPSSWGRHERIHFRDEELRGRLYADDFAVTRDGRRFLMLRHPDQDRPAPLIGLVACGDSGLLMVFP